MKKSFQKQEDAQLQLRLCKASLVMCPASLYQAGIKQKLKQLIKFNKPLNQFYLSHTLS
jgi:hypothetical protein